MASVGRPEQELSAVERSAAGDTDELAVTVVLLHGFGRYHGQLLDLWSEAAVNCPVVALQASFRMGPAAYRWFAYEDLPDGSVAIAPDEERRSRDALISYLGARRLRDPHRQLVLLGHSQGGMMALSVLLLRPDLIGGCAVLNGRILPETLAPLYHDPDLAGMPVFLGHGTMDPVVRVAKARSARPTLSRMGASLVYREYDSAHEVTSDMVADVARWLRTSVAGRRRTEVHS